MMVSVVVDMQIKDDEDGMSVARNLAQHPDVIKINVYETADARDLALDEIKFRRSFTRHIGSIGGPNYGG